MPAPQAIIAAPFTIFVGPVGTTFPAIDDAEGAFDAGWFKLGTSGDKDYNDDGVSVNNPRGVNLFRGAGSAFPRKAFGNEEDLMIGFQLADLGPEQHAKVLDDAQVTTVAASSGVAGEKSFPVGRGLVVAEFALLARGMSTVDNTLNAQYEVEVVIQDANQEPTYTKGNPALLAVQYRALDHDGDGFVGTLRHQSAVALS